MIYINDKPFEIEENLSLSETLTRLSIEVKKGVAIALNNSVIPKQEWESQQLKNNDKLLLIQAAQGG